MHPHPPSPPPRKLLKLKSPFLFIYYFIFGKSQIGWLLIRLHLFHISQFTLKSLLRRLAIVKLRQNYYYQSTGNSQLMLKSLLRLAIADLRYCHSTGNSHLFYILYYGEHGRCHFEYLNRYLIFKTHIYTRRLFTGIFCSCELVDLHAYEHIYSYTTFLAKECASYRLTA